MIKKIIFLFIILLLASTAIFAAVPQKFNYQGTLKEGGIFVTATKTMEFSIFDASSAGTKKWTSGQQTVNIINGSFRYVLEPTAVNWGTGPYYLEITIDGTVMSPREEIISSVYAIMAASIEDGAVVTQSIADGAITPQKLKLAGPEVYNILVSSALNSISVSTIVADGIITTQKLADEAVTGQKIAFGTILSTHLAGGNNRYEILTDSAIYATYSTSAAFANIADAANSLSNGLYNLNTSTFVLYGLSVSSLTTAFIYFPDGSVLSSSGSLGGNVSTAALANYFADKEAVRLSTTALNNAIILVSSSTVQPYFADKEAVRVSTTSLQSQINTKMAANNFISLSTGVIGVLPINKIDYSGSAPGTFLSQNGSWQVPPSADILNSTNTWSATNVFNNITHFSTATFSGIFYMGDPNTDGTWRFRIVDGDMFFEKRNGGEYSVRGSIK